MFDGVVARAMHKAADARFPSAGDLARAARAAAAGGFPAEPERMIARGAAAPAGAPQEPRAGAGERHGERGPPDGADGAGACPRARRWALAAVACAAAAAAATVVLLLDGEPSARGGAVVAPTPTATPIARVVSVTHDVGDRPGAIAHAAGDLWIGSRGLTRLTRIDAATGVKRRQQPRVGRGTVSVEAHGDLVWVAVADSRRVIGIDGRTGEIIRRIPLDGEPLRLRADGDGVWVLMRPVTTPVAALAALHPVRSRAGVVPAAPLALRAGDRRRVGVALRRGASGRDASGRAHRAAAALHQAGRAQRHA